MTKWEFIAECVSIKYRTEKEQIQTLCALLPIHQWEAERLLQQIKFNKEMGR